jgi:hypothetical protein
MEIYKDTLYSSGRYFVGLNNYFLKFPIGNQYAGTDFEIRSKEGLKVGLTILIAYKLGSGNLKREILPQLLNIYSNVKFNWKELVVRILQQNARDVIGTYSANQIILNRETISNILYSELFANLKYRGFLLTSLQLVELNLEKTYSDSLVQLEVVNQNAQQKVYLLEGLQVEAKTNVTLAGLDSLAIEYETINKALIGKKLGQDKLIALKARITALYSNMYSLKDKFKLSDSSAKSAASQLLTYYWGKIMQNEGNKMANMKLELPENLREN